MPHIATARTPEALAQAVRHHIFAHRFLAAVRVPSLLLDAPPRLALYSHAYSTQGAMAEGLADNPGATPHQEFEYVTQQSLHEKPSTLQDLGRITPNMEAGD